jgi:hypothetical protein
MTNSDVAAQACLAISGLAVKTRSDKEHKGNTRKLVARGAVENVVLCIKTYPEKAEVIRAGAMAVTALSRIDANRQKVGESGVVDLLIMGLTQHSAHAECIAKLAQAIEREGMTIVPLKAYFNEKGRAKVEIAIARGKKLRDRRGEVLFIDARKLATMISRVQSELTDEVIARISQTVAAWRSGTEDYQDIAGFCRSVPRAEIAQHGHVLTPGRYVGAEEVEDDIEAFADKMQTLTAKLGEQMAKGAELDALIRQKLGGLGYEF